MRSLVLLLALSAGCITTADKRIASLERELAEMRTPQVLAAPLPRLGGDYASEPIASLGTWVPVQSARRSIFGQSEPLGISRNFTADISVPSASKVCFDGAACTIYWQYTSSTLNSGTNVLTTGTVSAAGFTQTGGATTLSGVTISNYLVDTGIFYIRGASNYITNDNGTDPVRVLDAEGFCVGDLTGVNCDGTSTMAVIDLGTGGTLSTSSTNVIAASQSLMAGTGGDKDFIGSRVRVGTGVTLTIQGQMADGASSVGVILTNDVAAVNATARVVSFRLQSTEKAAVMFDGAYKMAGVVTGSLTACDADHEGALQYDTTTNKHVGCDGATWANLY
jgi:hypothetical protein